MTLLWVVSAYLLVGLLFLMVFQLTTHRIGKRLRDVATDVQMRLATTGAGIVTQKIAVGITLIYAWLFWIAVLIGYINDRRDCKLEKK